MDLNSHDSVDRAALEEIIRAELGADATERFLPLVRTSVGFSPCADSPGAGSTIGGPPRIPASFEWPHYGGQPMVLLAQVDCGQVARLLGEDWTLPDEGHLLFFHDDEFTAELDFALGDDGCRVVHVPARPDGSPREGDGPTLPVLPLEARPLLSLPYWGSAEADRAADGDTLALSNLGLALSDALPAPRHRLLGWCDSSDTPRPKGHRPLLQLEAEEGTDWFEVVNVSFWIRDEDLRAGELRHVRRSYEVA
ncbi:DUF1963 domain-containing protein [Streptomyces sp. NPDC059447]|uniref:DUF1963 domain-containing protein n=1 Tax=Streptomyces sp. NPDC059447 TaxID=3346834 RepID=UPI0036BB70A9